MKKYTFIILIILFVISFCLAVMIGSVSVAFDETFKILCNNLLNTNFVVDAGQNNIIFNIRLPRVVLAMLISLALATAGATIQGVYRNPMADTGVLGITSGASFGAIMSISLGLSTQSIIIMPIFSVIGALITSFGIFFFASRNGKVSILTLLLTGIAVSTLLRSLVNLILIFMDEGKTSEYLYWSMGSLSATRWEHVQLVWLPIVIGCILLMYYSKELNILMLGEEESQSMGNI